MKKKTNRLLSILLCCVMLIGLLPTVALAANNFVDFLTTDNNVEFAETGETGFYRVNLFGNGKAMKLPLVYRTDDLNLKFDGWYTAKVGGEKVTEDTVFNGYTILYDRWTEANIDSGKIINSITIPNSALVNGYTENDYINASGTLSLAGVVSGKNYTVYNGLNAYGSQVTGAETIDTSKDYSVVTTVKLQDGYYFAPNISLTAQHGVRAGVTYRADGVTTNTWNSLATTVDICINFPAGGNNVGFTTEPQSGVVEASQPYNFTWEVSGSPTAAELQMKSGNNWAKVDDLNINQTNGTISAQTGTKTYRILVTYANGSIYSNEFTVTWFDPNSNSFSMSPASGTVKNGSDYAFAWACVRTPATATIERKTGADWTSPEDLGTATSRTITYKGAYANSTQTFRIKANMATGDPFYSSEFTVTYKATPLFTVQPADGKVAINATYTVNYAFDKGDAQNDGDKVLQKYNGNDWDNISTSEVYFTQAVVPAQDAETTGTYRIGIQEDGNWTYSESFTVQWIDDYTFELDQNNLAWGSVAKADVYDGKIIKVMPTGTKTYTDDTLKYDIPNNFGVYKWKSPSGYYLLTFTPKASLDAGDYNENINIWATSNGSDEIGKTSVALSITIEAPTYTVSFDKNGGSGSMASVYNVSGSYELPTCTFTAPDGREFKSWQVNGGEEKAEGATITVTSNTTLTALWKDLPVVSGYTITFAAGEGTGTMSSVAGASGNYHLPSCTFTAPANKQFKAWQVNGQGEYQPGAPITVTTDTTVTALWKDIPVNNYTVYFSSANVCGVSGSYNATQYVEQGQAMTDIIVTANDGYYFPDPLTGQLSSNGVTVTRNSYTQVTISGTPNDNVTLGFGPNTKTKESTPNNLSFEATGANTGNLCNLENDVTYSVTGAATATFTASGSTYALTNVTEGTLNVVKKASNPNTKLDSDAYGYTVGKNNSVPNCYSTSCSDENNDNGQIYSVNADMEYKKSTDNAWTTGTGSNVTGLTPGTYYVRYKASSINLAGNAQTINIAAYNVPALTGTVTITGTAKYNEQLTATVTGSNNSGTLSYQWVRNTSNISGATGENYTLVEADINCKIKVVVTSTVQSGNITSAATATVEKADGPAAPSVTPVPCTNGSNNDGKITGTDTTMEYSTDSNFTSPVGTVCSATETTGLTAGTYYVRYKETTTHKAGTAATVNVAAYAPGALGGTASISGTAKYNETLTAVTSAITGNTGTFSYQWKRGSTNIGTNSATYTIVAADIGNTITVTVTSSVQSGNITSAATATIEKADGPAAPSVTPVPCTNGSNNDGKITGVTTAMEYSTASDFNSKTACTGTEITNLTNGTYYVRVAETATHKAGTAANVNVTAYDPGALGGTASISGTAKYNETLTAVTSAITGNTGTFSYQWKRGSTNIGTNSATYTIVAADIGNTITVTVTSSVQSGNITSAATATIEKADGPAAPSVTPVACTNGSNNDGKITGVNTSMEYSNVSNFASKTACTGTEITNLTNGTYYVRVAETATHKAGAAATVTVNPASGGGGGGGGYVPATYSLTVDKTENGSISVSPKSAAKGTTVTITVKPDEGYELDTLKVVDKNGNQVKLTEKDGKYTFTMPASKVTVTVTFAEIEQPMANPFIDVKESDYFYEAVLWAFKNGITDGTSDNAFTPNANCTRAQIVTFLWRAAGSPEPKSSENPFTDLKADAYYYEAVLWAAEQGITSGTGGGKFSPEAVCTRSQSVTLLYHAAGSPKVSGNASFSDVEPNAYYAAAVAWAEQNGVTGGIGGGLFGSANDCTRGQIVTFLYRFFVK